MAPDEHPLDGDVAEPEHVRRGGQVLRGEAERTPTFDQLLLDGRQPADLQLDDLLEGFPLDWGLQSSPLRVRAR